MRYALLVVWKDGTEEYLTCDANGSFVVRFTKAAAESQKEFMLMGMADEVQSISVVKYPKARG